jgi:hypothetical protein
LFGNNTNTFTSGGVETQEVNLIDYVVYVLESEQILKFSQIGSTNTGSKTLQMPKGGFGVNVVAELFLQKSIRGKIYTRQVYGILDACGDIGGLNDVVNLSVAFLFSLFVKRVFEINSVTQNFKFFPSQRSYTPNLDPPLNRVIKERDIEMLMRANSAMALPRGYYKIFTLLFVPCRCRKKTKLEKLVNKGVKRIDGSLDIANLLKLTQRLNILEKTILSSG